MSLHECITSGNCKTSDERPANRTASALEWFEKDTKHSTTSGSNELVVVV